MYEYEKKKARGEFDRIDVGTPRQAGLFSKKDKDAHYNNEFVNREYTESGLPIHRIQIRESDAGYNRDSRDVPPQRYNQTGLFYQPDSVRHSQGKWLSSIIIQQSHPQFGVCLLHGILVCFDVSTPKSPCYKDYAGQEHPPLGGQERCIISPLDTSTAAACLDNPRLTQVMTKTHELFESLKQGLRDQEGDLSHPSTGNEAWDWQPARSIGDKRKKLDE